MTFEYIEELRLEDWRAGQALRIVWDAGRYAVAVAFLILSIVLLIAIPQ